MARQRSFDWDPPHNGTRTSRAAAESVAPLVTGWCLRIMAHLAAAGEYGATCDEVEAALGLRHQTASARMNELHYRHGTAVATGTTRATRSGRHAEVYRIAAPGERCACGDSRHGPQQQEQHR